MIGPTTVLVMLALSGTPAPSNEAESIRDDNATLRQLTQQLLDAVATGDKAVWERVLDDRMIHVDENGVVRTKQELIAELSPLPPGLQGSLTIDRFEVRHFGDVAVVAQEAQEHLDYHGQALRSRFRSVDTWRRDDEGWRLIGEQTTAVLKDPPSIAMSSAQLCTYAGQYELTETITTTIRCENDALVATRAGRPQARYLPETRDVFFQAGQPRTRRLFVRDERGEITAFVDRREGEDIRWLKVNPPPASKP